jgi:hypothetical protein
MKEQSVERHSGAPAAGFSSEELFRLAGVLVCSVTAMSVHWVIMRHGSVDVRVGLNAFRPFSDGFGMIGILFLLMGVVAIAEKKPAKALLLYLGSALTLFAGYIGAEQFILIMGPERLSEALSASRGCLLPEFASHLTSESIPISKDVTICGK